MMSEAEAGLWGIGFGLAVPLNMTVGERLDMAKHEGETSQPSAATNH
jgi:hypothetical protein